MKKGSQASSCSSWMNLSVGYRSQMPEKMMWHRVMRTQYSLLARVAPEGVTFVWFFPGVGSDPGRLVPTWRLIGRPASSAAAQNGSYRG